MLTAIKTMTPTMSTIFLENIDMNGSEFLHPKAITAYFFGLGFGFKHGLPEYGRAACSALRVPRDSQPEPFRL